MNDKIPIEEMNTPKEDAIPVEAPVEIPVETPVEKPVEAPVEKPGGMTEKASKMFDMMSKVKSEKKLPPAPTERSKGFNINKVENKFQAKFNKIWKGRRRNHKAKQSRKVNRKK